MRREAELRAMQSAQLGLISLDQVLALGGTRKLPSHRVRKGAWKRLLPGVYADALVPPSLRQSSLAALLWAGDDAVISHTTAGALWAFDGLHADGVHLWTPRRCSSKLVVVHRGNIDTNDRRMLGPITLTSPARTLLDLAGTLDDEDLNAVVEDAILRGLTTAPAIDRRLDALGGKGRAASHDSARFSMIGERSG